MIAEERLPRFEKEMDAFGAGVATPFVPRWECPARATPRGRRMLPKAVGSSHLQDQGSHHGADFWTSALLPGPPGPEPAKALATPGHVFREVTINGAITEADAAEPDELRLSRFADQQRKKKTKQRPSSGEHGLQVEGRHWKKSCFQPLVPRPYQPRCRSRQSALPSLPRPTTCSGRSVV
jgi:hypothetical protein